MQMHLQSLRQETVHAGKTHHPNRMLSHPVPCKEHPMELLRPSNHPADRLRH
jgi:hypothetical protein